MNVNKFKLILSIFFLVFGLTCAVLIYVKPTYTYNSTSYRQVRGGSVAEYQDGMAIGLSIISSFSFLSSVLLLNSINKIKD